MTPKTTCEAEWGPGSEYFGSCGAVSRYRVERPGDGYEPMELCPTHLADGIVFLVDGDDVPVTVHVNFDQDER